MGESSSFDNLQDNLEQQETVETIETLKNENELLRLKVLNLEKTNKILKQNVLIETFEGEGLPDMDEDGNFVSKWFEERPNESKGSQVELDWQAKQRIDYNK